MRKKTQSVLAFVTLLLLSFMLWSPSKTGADVTGTEESSGEITKNEGNAVQISPLNECNILQYVDEKDFVSNKYVKRLPGEES